jgi:hypothetical protein
MVWVSACCCWKAQDRQLEVGLLPGKRRHEGHDIVDFLRGEGTPQLQFAHDFHRFFQGLGFVVVEAGEGEDSPNQPGRNTNRYLVNGPAQR